MPAPSAIVRDGAHAISNAANEVWPGVPQVQCWAHVVMGLDKHWSLIKVLGADGTIDKTASKAKASEVKTAIYDLQLSSSPDRFKNAVKLFIKHYINDASVSDFLHYFRSTWLDDASRSSWYEGYKPMVPSTNNANEASNLDIKRTWTARQQLSLSRMLDKFEKKVLLMNQNNRTMKGTKKIILNQWLMKLLP